MWVQKHTQMPGKGQTENNVVGSPFYPTFMAKTGAYFLFTFGVLALLGAFAQINPIWLFGPYTPADISAGSQPDFYMGFLEGSLRLMPAWEINLLGHTIPLSVVIPALLPMGIIFTGLLLYPVAERWITGDEREHHLCDRPRNNPHRTAIGVASISFFSLLTVMGANDWVSAKFHIPLYTTTEVGRVLIFLGPAIAYFVTYRVCIGLQRKDLEMMIHGVESGVIKRMPNGEYIEVHVHPSDELLELVKGKKSIPAMEAGPDGGGVLPKVMRNPLGRLRARLSESYSHETEAISLEAPEQEGRERQVEEVHRAAGSGDRDHEGHPGQTT
jgi:ubiquinol-cytochrome c reductase cytochrome b subunit